MTMLDTTTPSVLSYARSTGASSVVVAMNCTDQSQTISLDPSAAGVTGTKVKTLLTDDRNTEKKASLKNVTIAPYSSWIASVESTGPTERHLSIPANSPRGALAGLEIGEIRDASIKAVHRQSES